MATKGDPRSTTDRSVTATILREAKAVLELPRLLLRSPKLADAPKGSGPVMLFPGYGTSDAVLLPLRGYLGSRGYEVRGWGHGRNIGHGDTRLDSVETGVDRFVEEVADGPAKLVGWSLGGVFAREVARNRPQVVERVCTFGTPVAGGPPLGNKALIQVPITAIYSRNDRVIDWRRSVDDVNPDVEHVEVDSTHAGMIVDPDVWLAIAHALAGDGA